ncbi:hypothetical protein YC2023_018294 [Brassica napus]
MASNKGKGILLEEDDDPPILLPDQADEHLIKEYSLSLIGKILNPKKHNVERLISNGECQKKITACDLGNGRFLFNFDNEEDLMSVLNQGPFHHNYCMFVLVRWEPMIADDYPSMVPFLIQLKGIPLHLCTHQNLETIGDWLGKVDKIYAAEGKIKVYIDSSNPLKFTRKLQTRNKEDINIKLHYEMLFKHCTGCDLMSHGTQDFLKKAIALQNLQVPRETIFDRVCNNPTRGEVREVGIRGTSEVEREKDVTSYKSQRDTSRSASRAPPSKHSEVTKERQWREKQFRPLKISERGSGSVATASQRSEVAPVATKKMHSDSKVTYRSNSVVSDTATTDDLIHHYDALKIDALNDFENDIEEGDAADADMEEAFVGS